MTTIGYHVHWTAPQRAGSAAALGYHHRGRGTSLEEVITTVHSAHAWRAMHGPIHLATDADGADQFRALGLLELYDRVDIWLDELDQDNVDPTVYFTAGKFAVLRRATEPMALLDSDFYLRRPVSDPAGGFLFAHRETLGPRIYPDREDLPVAPGYRFPDLDYKQLPANMALAWFGCAEHARQLGEEALRFARGNNGVDAGHRVIRPAFAEQRLASAMASTMGLAMTTLTDRVWDSDSGTWQGSSYADVFHHTWNQKGMLRNFPELKPAYCRYLLEDLALRQPEAADRLMQVLRDGPHVENARRVIADVAHGGPSTLEWRHYA